MKILVITPRVPYPPFSGMQVRVYHLFKHLSKNHELALVCYRYEANDMDAEYFLKNIFSYIKTIPDTFRDGAWTKTSLFHKIKETFQPPIDLLNYATRKDAMNKAIVEVLDSDKFDVVYLSCFDMLTFIPTISPMPFVLDVIDDAALHAYNDFKMKSNLRAKIKRYAYWRQIRNFERSYLGSIPHIIMISSIDAEYFHSFCTGKSINVITNGIDIDFFQPDSINHRQPVLMFSGNMDYSPNEEAAVYFILKIFPLVLEKIPEAVFMVVGRNPTNRLQELAGQNCQIQVTGFVEDIRTWFNKAMIYVSPLLTGAGLKNKILEAWAMGKATIATPISVDGIEAIHGKNIILAEQPDEFITAIVELYQNSAYREQLAQTARQDAVNKYNWQIKAIELETILEKIVSERNG
jgi:sugar transferase (PEP-CTERM/EpsH1 system associated)